MRNVAREPLCSKCGQKLYGLLSGGVERLSCLVCSTANPATAVYCTNCGRNHADPLPASSPPTAALADLAAPAPRVVAGAEQSGVAASARGSAPVVRAASPAAAAPFETAAHHRALGCIAAIAGTVLFVVLFALLARQTQQALLIETVQTVRTSDVAELTPDEPLAHLDRMVVGASGQGHSEAPSLTAPQRSSRSSAASTPRAAPGSLAPRQTSSMRLQLDGLSVEPTIADRPAPPGHRYVVATATIENLSVTALPYDGASAQLVAGDGTTYRPLPGLAGAIRSGSLLPGQRVSGRIAFDVPHRRDLTLQFGGVALDLSDALP